MLKGVSIKNHACLVSEIQTDKHKKTVASEGIKENYLVFIPSQI